MNFLRVSGEYFFECFNDVMNILGPKLSFAYYSPDDLYQESFIHASKIIEKFSPKRGHNNLRAFLYTSLSRNIHNLYRKVVERKTPPCYTCPQYCKSTKNCLAFKDKMECSLYRNWVERNAVKKNLSSPETINIDVARPERLAQDEDVRQEILALGEKLSPKSKKILSDLLSGVKVRKMNFDYLIEEIKCLKPEDLAMLKKYL